MRNVESMNYADIEKAIAELSEKARNNTLAVEDMDGGTFTVSNGGVFGSLMGTPIINLPQSAILGMHAIVRRPVAIGEQVIHLHPMYANIFDRLFIYSKRRSWSYCHSVTESISMETLGEKFNMLGYRCCGWQTNCVQVARQL